MHNSPFHAPIIKEQIKTAMDIGCGTGPMTVLLADFLPNATVFGIDLSPIPKATKLETERYGGRVRFIEGNIFNLVGKHPALAGNNMDFVFHRLLNVGVKSFEAYLRNVVFPLLRPGGWAEMQDLFGERWYQSDPDIPGRSRCVSHDWLWTKTWDEAKTEHGKQDNFDTIVPFFQILDFEDVGHTLYRLPWAPVKGHPEGDAWAAYAPQGLTEVTATAVSKAIGEHQLKRIGEENLRRSVYETIGRPVEGMWWPLAVAWGRKPL